MIRQPIARGRVKARSQPVTGTATVAGSADAVHGRVGQHVVAKYGSISELKLLNTIDGAVKRKRIPDGDRAVLVTLD